MSKFQKTKSDLLRFILALACACMSCVAAVNLATEGYCSCFMNSTSLIISTLGHGIFFSGLKCLSLVTIYSASEAIAQSTNLLSSESAGNKLKVHIRVLHGCRGEIGNRLHYVLCDFRCRLLSHDFFVFLQNIGIDAQTNLSLQYIRPNLMVRTSRRQNL